MKEVIGLDVDDVIAGFYLGMCEHFNMPPIKTDIWDGKVACKWVADNFKLIQYDFDFWKNLPIIADPSSITFDFDYYISAFPEEMFDARMFWLNAGNFPDKPLLCTDDKLKTCREKGITVLVDDKKETIEQVNAGGILGIRFRPYYMIEDGQDIDRLDQVPEFIKSKR